MLIFQLLASGLAIILSGCWFFTESKVNQHREIGTVIGIVIVLVISCAVSMIGE